MSLDAGALRVTFALNYTSMHSCHKLMLIFTKLKAWFTSRDSADQPDKFQDSHPVLFKILIFVTLADHSLCSSSATCSRTTQTWQRVWSGEATKTASWIWSLLTACMTTWCTSVSDGHQIKLYWSITQCSANLVSSNRPFDLLHFPLDTKSWNLFRGVRLMENIWRNLFLNRSYFSQFQQVKGLLTTFVSFLLKRRGSERTKQTR